MADGRERPARPATPTSRQHREIAAEVAAPGRTRRPVARRVGPGLLLALRAARASRGSSPTSTTISARCTRRGVGAVVARADRVRLRPHGGRPRPRHRGGGDGGRARPGRSPGPPRSGRPPPSSPGWSTCSRSGRPWPAASGRAQPVVGALGPWPSVCVAGCCPNPRAERPAACGADWVAPPVDASRPMSDRPATGGRRPLAALVARRAGGPAGRRPGPRRPAGHGSTSPRPSPRRPTSSPRWTPRRRRCCARQIQAARPDDGILGEEGGLVAGDQRPDLGRRPDRRHGQLPVRHPGLRDQRGGRHRRPARPGRPRGPGRLRAPPALRRDLDRDARRRRLPGRPADPGQHRRAARPGAGRTGFGYDVERRRHAARVVAQVLPAGARHPADRQRGARPGRPGQRPARRATTSAGSGAWDLAAGGLIAREAGAVVGGLDGQPAGRSWWSRPHRGFTRSCRSCCARCGPDRDG